jgi:hypothetical protein
MYYIMEDKYLCECEYEYECDIVNFHTILIIALVRIVMLMMGFI